MVISGGQTGADLGALKAAKDSGLATSGWMPKGFKNETGLHPEFADLYGMQEHWSGKYRYRTYLNVEHSDITLWFGNTNSKGFNCTLSALHFYKKLFWIAKAHYPKHIAEYLLLDKVNVLNVAGNRESVNCGIEENTYQYLMEVFKHYVSTNC